MSHVKRELFRKAHEWWHLVYDRQARELYVEFKDRRGVERIALAEALTMEGDGPDGLRLLIADVFKPLWGPEDRS
jgi:hypothetical protein